MVEVKHLRHVVKPLSVLYIVIRTYRLCECRSHAHKLQRFQGHAEAQLQRFLLFLRGLNCTRQYQCTLTLSCLHFLYNHMYHQSNQLTSHFARLGAVITPPWQYCMRAPESSTATSGEAHRAKSMATSGWYIRLEAISPPFPHRMRSFIVIPRFSDNFFKNLSDGVGWEAW